MVGTTKQWIRHDETANTWWLDIAGGKEFQGVPQIVYMIMGAFACIGGKNPQFCNENYPFTWIGEEPHFGFNETTADVGM